MAKQMKITAAARQQFSKVTARIVRQTAMNVQIKPSTSIVINGKTPNSQNFNNVYGILPFAMTATKAELEQAIEQFELKKYALIDAGDYYGSWLATQRQRILAGVLSGMVTFSLDRLA